LKSCFEFKKLYDVSIHTALWENDLNVTLQTILHRFKAFAKQAG